MKLGFVPIAGVSVTTCGLVVAKGSVGISTSGPLRKSLPGAATAWSLDRLQCQWALAVELNFGRQDVWRPGAIGMVSSELAGGTSVISDCWVVGLGLRARTGC